MWNSCNRNLSEKTTGFRLKHKLCLQITASTPKRKHLFYQRGISLIPCRKTFSDYFRKLKTSFIHLRMIELPLQIVVQIHEKDHLHSAWLHESPKTRWMQGRNRIPSQELRSFTRQLFTQCWQSRGTTFPLVKRTQTPEIQKMSTFPLMKLLWNKKQFSHFCTTNLINGHLELAFSHFIQQTCPCHSGT